MNAPSKKMKTNTKTTAVGGGAGLISTYLAMLASQKWGIPLEVSSAAVAGVTALVARWAGKLIPE